MKAARWYAARDIRVEDIEKPKAGPGEVVIQVKRCGICGTISMTICQDHTVSLWISLIR